MPEGFNDLELAILRWLQHTYVNPQLSAQIDAAILAKREWTRVGFFVYLDVPRTLESIKPNDFGQGWPIDGPALESEDIEDGGGSIVWGTDGYIDCIEMYAYGSFFNQHVKSFELHS